MRIAIYYNLNFGGAKRVVMCHAKGLKNMGHVVDLYTINHEKDAFDPSPYCDKTYNYIFNQDKKTTFFKRFIQDYNIFFTLKKLHKKIAFDIDSRDYNIVLVHPDKLTQAPFLLRFLKTPSIYYCQEPLRIVYEYSYRLKEKVGFVKRAYEELTRLYRKLIDRQNVRSASFTITSCYHVRERMIESYEVYPNVIYCAVDERVFRPMRVKKKYQVFYVGSPTVWEDGYDLAKDAIELIPGEIRPELYTVSWKKENGQRLSEKELVRIYSESLVTLCPSRMETFGLVPLESMACGVPVIATKVGGHRETVEDGKTGFLVDFDPREIAEKITLFLRDFKLSREMGMSGREAIIDRWTWRIQIKNLESLLMKYAKKRYEY